VLGAIPYFFTRPIVDRIVARVIRARAASGLKEPPGGYNSPWPMARDFYQEAWRRGFDIKFGLASVVMQALCMAPISALGVVAMFYFLRRVFGSDQTAFRLALLYAFGTPVFFRTGLLNHNMMMAILRSWDSSRCGILPEACVRPVAFAVFWADWPEARRCCLIIPA
jgi:hypothetical protein